MTFKFVSSKNNKKIFDKISNASKDVRIGIEKGFQELGANLVRTGQNQILNEPKFGIEYKIKQDGVTKLHRASSAGQTPALLTGNYFENFKYLNHPDELEFGNDAEYSGFLEDGTEKMEPRPGVKNAVTTQLRNARLYLENSLKDELEL